VLRRRRGSVRGAAGAAPPRLRWSVVVLAIAVGGLSAPASAGAVGWGINLAGPLAGNPPAFSFQSNPYFTELLGGTSCREPNSSNGLCYARIYVPWDAVNDGKGSVSNGTCQPSPSGPGTAGAAFAQQLSAATRAVGVSHVLISLTTALPSSTADIWPTDAEYQCGLSGLERQAPGVTEWQVFNEPDSIYPPDSAATGAPDCTRRNGVWLRGSNGAYLCVFGSPGVTPPGGNGHGGSAQGAAYWYLDAKKVDSSPAHTLLAGGFNYSSSRCIPSTCYYPKGYFRVLSHIYPHAPDAVALNPYIDVMYAALNGGNPVPSPSTGLPSARGAIAVIDQYFPTNPPVWFTEGGVWLTDSGKEPVTSLCGDGNPQVDGAWSACLNGNPTAQALAAEGYLRLPSESAQVQRIYYYDFDGQNQGWDSGLVNVSPPLLGPRGYGTPRTVWCVLHSFAQGASPSAAESAAARPGSPCNDENPAHAGYAPVVDQAYLSDPLPIRPTPPAPALSPGEVCRDAMLTIAERVREMVAPL
jgi:hypothetical protein